MNPDIYAAELKVVEALASFKIKVRIASVAHRYTCIRFRFDLLSSQKVSMNRLLDVESKLYEETGQLARIRKCKDSIVAEIPNPHPPVFYFDNVKDKLRKADFILPLALGHTDYGRDVIVDLLELPHLLICGGEAGWQNNLLEVLIASMSEARTPDEVKFIIADSAGNGLDKYSDSPYLAEQGIIKGCDAIIETLDWLADELFYRYYLIAGKECLNIARYNEKSEDKIPYLVTIINDIVPLQPRRKDFEIYLCKIAAKAKAAGIHLILMSSKASAEVISGTVKNNIPAKIAFKAEYILQSKLMIDTPDAVYLSYPDDILFSHPRVGIEKRLKSFHMD